MNRNELLNELQTIYSLLNAEEITLPLGLLTDI